MFHNNILALHEAQHYKHDDDEIFYETSISRLAYVRKRDFARHKFAQERENK